MHCARAFCFIAVSSTSSIRFGTSLSFVSAIVHFASLALCGRHVSSADRPKRTFRHFLPKPPNENDALGLLAVVLGEPPNVSGLAVDAAAPKPPAVVVVDGVDVPLAKLNPLGLAVLADGVVPPKLKPPVVGLAVLADGVVPPKLKPPGFDVVESEKPPGLLAVFVLRNA